MSVALLVACVVAAAAVAMCVGLYRELQEVKRSGVRIAEVLQRANSRYVERCRELEGLLADRSRVEIGIPVKAKVEDEASKVRVHPAVIAEIEGLEDQEARDEYMLAAWQYYERMPHASAGEVIEHLFPSSVSMAAEVEA